jgi:hypothetical protein
MKIVIKEMSKDKDKLLVYLMTDDDIPVKCEMTTRLNSKEVIDNLTPSDNKDITTITYKYADNVLNDGK